MSKFQKRLYICFGENNVNFQDFSNDMGYLKTYQNFVVNINITLQFHK